jgi:hypothetical protein
MISKAEEKHSPNRNTQILGSSVKTGRKSTAVLQDSTNIADLT